MIDSALRSSQRMTRLVTDLLLLARADAGKAGAHRRCDLAEVAGNAALEAAPLLGDRELRVENDRELWLEGNPDELHRMILNLLDNAARHTPPGSIVGLRLRADGGDAVVEVFDDGPGIAPELRGLIFDRFVRGGGPADTATGPAAGSAWRSSAPSPPRTAARRKRTRRPAAGPCSGCGSRCGEQAGRAFPAVLDHL